MASPTTTQTRSPLKETDANLRQVVPAGKKRVLELHRGDGEQGVSGGSVAIKRPRIERSRSIEGAVLVSKTAALRTLEQKTDSKVAPRELLEWQRNWRRIMKRDSKIYFDITEDADTAAGKKRVLDKRQEVLKRGFLSLGAEISQFFDNSNSIVITRRSTDAISSLPSTDVLYRAKKRYMKVWGYEKATRFLTNLDVDLEEIKEAVAVGIATPSLSNLLQNEKLYGPNDRDPRTKRDDTHYFKHPHVYMYDLWQIWSPIVILEWKQQDLNNKDRLPYPTLKYGTVGHCPFVGDRDADETAYKRVVRRYARDKANKKYALRLRMLYQNRAEPYPIMQDELIMLPHGCNDSRCAYKKCIEASREMVAKREAAEHSQDNSSRIEEVRNVDEAGRGTPAPAHGADAGATANPAVHEDIQPSVPQTNYAVPTTNTTSTANNSAVYKEPPTPRLKRPVLASFTRQDTEDLFPEDFCSSKRQSRVNFEIKASGVHQSNDAATSFGNGLGPTKASVTSKNIKSLSRMVVDRKQACAKPRKLVAAAIPRPASLSLLNGVQGQASTTTDATVSNTMQRSVNNTVSNASAQITAVNEAAANVPPQKSKPVAQRLPIEKSSGYCENCRVKYNSLYEHVQSEKHLTFAENPMNFEAIDSLIERLKFQF